MEDGPTDRRTDGHDTQTVRNMTMIRGVATTKQGYAKPSVLQIQEAREPIDFKYCYYA